MSVTERNLQYRTVSGSSRDSIRWIHGMMCGVRPPRAALALDVRRKCLEMPASPQASGLIWRDRLRPSDEGESGPLADLVIDRAGMGMMRLVDLCTCTHVHTSAAPRELQRRARTLCRKALRALLEDCAERKPPC
eukprot:scaffold31293_cov146-Isochrysis_galbana.AAC.1